MSYVPQTVDQELANFYRTTKAQKQSAIDSTKNTTTAPEQLATLTTLETYIAQKIFYGELSMTPNAHLDVDVDCDEDILEARLDEVLESSEYWNLCAAVLSEASSRLDTEHTVSEEPPAAIVEGAGIEHILILRELGKIMAATGDAISRLRALGMMPLDFAAPRNNDPLWFLVDRSISATIVRSLLGNARASVCLFALGAARRHPVSAHVRACLVSWLFGGAQHYLAYLAAIHPTTAEFVRFVPASMRINLDEIVALHKRAALGYEYALRVANETHSSVWAVSEREGTDTESSDGD